MQGHRGRTVADNKAIRVIPQGTVDNNLGPDRLAGPKALDPNYSRQLFDCTTFVLESYCAWLSVTPPVLSQFISPTN